MLQQTRPDDFVIATGETHSVREFVETAFRYVGRAIQWRGEGIDETGHDVETDQVLVRINPKYFRPTEVVRYRLSLSNAPRCDVDFTEFPSILFFSQDVLLGDASKARDAFGWKPTVTFDVSSCRVLVSEFCARDVLCSFDSRKIQLCFYLSFITCLYFRNL